MLILALYSAFFVLSIFLAALGLYLTDVLGGAPLIIILIFVFAALNRYFNDKV